MSESEENRIVVENEWHRISKTVKWDEERFSDFVRRFALLPRRFLRNTGAILLLLAEKNSNLKM